MNWFNVQLKVFFILCIFFCLSHSLQDYYICDKPPEDSNRTNCVSDHLGFPSTLATCYHCSGKTIQFKCKKNKKWEPLSGKHSQSCDSQIPPVISPVIPPAIPPNPVSCRKPSFVHATCPDLQPNTTYAVGHTTICICKTTCQKMIAECNETKSTTSYEKWNFEFLTEGNCNGKNISKDGALNIYYKKVRESYGEYTFDCDTGFDLVSGSPQHLTCTDGKLNGTKPSCKQTGPPYGEGPGELPPHSPQPVSVVTPTPQYCNVTTINKKRVNCLSNIHTRYTEGEKITCKCLRNCRQAILTCDPSYQWQEVNNNKLSNYCASNITFTTEFEDGKLKATFKNGAYYFECKEGYQFYGEDKITCIANAGTLYDRLPECLDKTLNIVPTTTTEISITTMLATTSSDALKDEEGVDKNIPEILYYVIGIFGVLFTCLFLYFLYTRHKRGTLEERVSADVLEMQENEYEYPVFENRNNVQQEEGVYDYAVFPGSFQTDESRNVSEFQENDLYQSVDAKRRA